MSSLFLRIPTTKQVCLELLDCNIVAYNNVGFKTQSMLLGRMFYFIESGKIAEPIYTPEQAQPGTSNKDFLRDFVGKILQQAFPNLQA